MTNGSYFLTGGSKMNFKKAIFAYANPSNIIILAYNV
jgi:hypothetical protein